MNFRNCCVEQFFRDRAVANRMMLAIDICLMLNCFLFEKFYLHYAQCDFDSILLHCIKLFIRQSIDREQTFDVTVETPPLKNPAYATVWRILLSALEGIRFFPNKILWQFLEFQQKIMTAGAPLYIFKVQV